LDRVAALVSLTLILACSSSEESVADGGADAPVDATPADSALPDGTPGDAAGSDAPATDAGTAGGELSDHRDRLLATLSSDTCVGWASFDASQRAVFLTLTHRLYIARTPDGMPVIAHITRLFLVLGGGADGTSCGGDENNRLFLAMDAYLHGHMVTSWAGSGMIEDGGGGFFVHTRDIAGPHDPFDASVESDVGLDCALLVERSGSRPPTAQAHFFLEGSAAPVERGSRVMLAADPYMLEIDHDYDCLHRSNPTCSDFERRYRDNYGDFECEWVPFACTPMGTGCYRGVELP
jgi:hypothetical protein